MKNLYIFKLDVNFKKFETFSDAVEGSCCGIGDTAKDLVLDFFIFLRSETGTIYTIVKNVEDSKFYIYEKNKEGIFQLDYSDNDIEKLCKKVLNHITDFGTQYAVLCLCEFKKIFEEAKNEKSSID